MKQYRSFEEIDRDLEILQLQNQIDKEQIKLSYSGIKEGLSPKYLLESAACAVKKKTLELAAVVKGVGKSVING